MQHGNRPGDHRPKDDAGEEDKIGIDEQVAVGEGGHLSRPAVAGPAPVLKSKSEVIKQVTGDLEFALENETPEGDERLKKAAIGLSDAVRMRLGARYRMESAGHAPGYDTKLQPATQNFLKNEPALRQQAQGVVADVDPLQVKKDHDRIELLSDVGQEFRQLGADLEAAQTHPEQRNDRVLRNVKERIEPQKKTLGRLADEMDPVMDYASGSAQQGVETKVTVGKAVGQATARTAAWYQGQGGGGTTAGGGSAAGGGTPPAGGAAGGSGAGQPSGTLPGGIPGSSSLSGPPDVRPPRGGGRRTPR